MSGLDNIEVFWDPCILEGKSEFDIVVFLVEF